MVVHRGINYIPSKEVQPNEQFQDLYVNFKTKTNEISMLLPTEPNDCDVKVEIFSRL